MRRLIQFMVIFGSWILLLLVLAILTGCANVPHRPDTRIRMGPQESAFVLYSQVDNYTCKYGPLIVDRMGSKAWIRCVWVQL